MVVAAVTVLTRRMAFTSTPGSLPRVALAA